MPSRAQFIAAYRKEILARPIALAWATRDPVKLEHFLARLNQALQDNVRSFDISEALKAAWKAIGMINPPTYANLWTLTTSAPEPDPTWSIIPDDQVCTVWRNEGGNEHRFQPTHFIHNGAPINEFSGDDMVYLRTEICIPLSGARMNPTVKTVAENPSACASS